MSSFTVFWGRLFAVLCSMVVMSMMLCYQFAGVKVDHLQIPSSCSHEDIRQLRAASEVRASANESAGDFLGAGFIPNFFSDMSIKDAQHLLYGAVTYLPFNCSTSERIGREGDGGYQVCTQEPYKPKLNDCLVYSFGINNEWSFDDGMNSRFGCEVHSFDPSMNKTDHIHKENMYFHNLGVWGTNFKNSRGWEMKDLQTIVQLLGHTDRTIDYLKVDVEGAEWPLIEHIIQSGIHSQVKQMAMELHTPRLQKAMEKMTVNDYGEIFNGLHQLNNAGFRKYLYHPNNCCCGRFTIITSAKIARENICCYETFYVNSCFSKRPNSV